METVFEQEQELEGEDTLESGTSKIQIADDYKQIAKEVAKEPVVQAG